MPGFRQKVAGFIRQLSNPPDNRPCDKQQSKSNECFIQRYLNGQDNGRDEPKIVHGRTPQQLPPKTIGTLSKPILSAMTGPNGGLTTVNKKRRHLSISDPDVRFIDTTDEDSPPGSRDANSNTSTVNCNLVPLQKCESTPNAVELVRCGSGDGCEESVIIAGVSDWESPTSNAYGRSVSLYEKHPVTGVPAGEPIADCFAVVSRKNSAILCLADGVNWGAKASLAAKAAVHGCVDYLNQALFGAHTVASTTEAFVALLRSFHAAHNLILEENGMLTTLTAVLVLPLVVPQRYIACACNVGDSLAYVYSHKHGVREITQGSHDVHRMRDMRDALGALGPVDGTNPELANLTCAMTEVEPGDIVFITSDGVSDNLDPVVGKFTGLGGVEAEQRHRLGLLRTEDLLRNGVSGHGPPCHSARGLVDLMLDFVTRLTSAKRRLLEDEELYRSGGQTQQRAKRKQMCGKLAAVPGKLDHATVVAYTVHGSIAQEQHA
uniref:Putative serine/threonine protein phosphatase signal transduction mechanism n=1 Tax=Panstrongylus lignarius TaxID=156445 RepID=A0A224XBK7_9HEMI